MSSCQNLHCPDREFRAADADFSNLKSQRRPRQSVTFNSETAIAELLTSTSTANFVIGFLLLSSRFTEAVARLFKTNYTVRIESFVLPKQVFSN